MQKNLIITAFIISLLIALFLSLISLGWFMIIFGLVGALVLILHITGGVLSFKAIPRSTPLLLASSFCLILLALLKYDFDDVGAYSGFSQLRFWLGATERPYIDIGKAHHYTFLVFLAIQLILDFLLIKKFGWKKKAS